MGFLNFLGSIGTNIANAKMNKRSIDYSWKALNAQNQFNIDQWNRENEYNTPTAQMQRFLAAGINPWNAMSNFDNGNASSLTSAPYSSPSMIPMQAPPDPIGGLIDNISSALDGGLKVLDVLKGSNTLPDVIKGTNALNQGYVLDTLFNRDTLKAKTAATNQIYKSQEYTAANEAAYQLALSKYDLNEKAATTFSNWITSRQTARQALENMVDNHLLNKKALEWFDKDHEANFEKQMASAGVDRQQIKRMKAELPFVTDYIKAQIDQFRASAESAHENAVDLRETRWSRNNQMNMGAFAQQQQGYFAKKQNRYFFPSHQSRLFDTLNNPKIPWYKKIPAAIVLGGYDANNFIGTMPMTPFDNAKTLNQMPFGFLR